MSDIIHLLPDSVANQIAAGEVIQRPASVIKELVENALDAGATRIQVIVKGAGRTSIQVIDNGKGMSETDARLAFERHATSKIAQASDLFALHTMGFRGEALASIAAVAHVEMKTRQATDEIGTLLSIAGSKVERQEPCSNAVGTSILVSDLFYNVPARRKFLKSDETELRNIIQEMQRIVLINPSIAFQLYSGEDIVYDLSEGNFKQRITAIFGKKNRNLNQQLIKIEANTNLVNISGYVGVPEAATKSANQFFFVNNRYMNHPYFRKAVLLAYERMIQPDTTPPFFIDIQVDPATIDVNIHPTKTEIKFENEREIWSILTICIKEALGKFNITPTIDFNTEGKIEMPIQGASTSNQMPPISVNPQYNPFHPQPSRHVTPEQWKPIYEESLPKLSPEEQPTEQAWGLDYPYNSRVVDEFYHTEQSMAGTEEIPLFQNESDSQVFQYKKRFICTSVMSGLMLIDIRRAKLRLFYEQLLEATENKQGVSQQLLFPEILELTPDDFLLFTEIELDLEGIGFKFEPFGKYALNITGMPAILPTSCSAQAVVDDLIAHIKSEGVNMKGGIQSFIAKTIANEATHITVENNMCSEEMNHLIGKLFTCSDPNTTPDGEKIVFLLKDSWIQSRF